MRQGERERNRSHMDERRENEIKGRGKCTGKERENRGERRESEVIVGQEGDLFPLPVLRELPGLRGELLCPIQNVIDNGQKKNDFFF